MCMKKWVFHPPKKKQKRGSWTLALKILSYEQPMEPYKVCGAFQHSFESKIRVVVREKLGVGPQNPPK